MKVVDAPKHKKDWVGKSLMLKEACLEGYLKPLDGIAVRIYRRLNAMETRQSGQDVSRWGKVRVLKCSWRCPNCGARHEGYLPESWIEEGKAFFCGKRRFEMIRKNELANALKEARRECPAAAECAQKIIERAGISPDSLLNSFKNCSCELASLVNRSVVKSYLKKPDVPKVGDYVETPRFCKVRIKAVLTANEAREQGFIHTTDLRNMPYKVFGRCLGENLMDFALIPGQ